MIARPTTNTLFPYTTLFRSLRGAHDPDPARRARHAGQQLARLRLRSRRPHDRALLRDRADRVERSEEHTSELQSHSDLVCRLLLEKKKETIRARIDQAT